MNKKFKSAEKWDQRFDSDEYKYGKDPNEFLKNNFTVIPKGNVLCVGEGEGRNAVFLAKNGYHVTALDYSITGLKKVEVLAKENNVDIELIHSDVTKYNFKHNQWHGVISIFCHIHKDFRKNLNQNCVKSLLTNGIFFLEGYSPNQLKYQTGGPKDKDLLMNLTEVKNELKGLDFIISHEIKREIYEGSMHNGLSSVIQIIGKKTN